MIEKTEKNEKDEKTEKTEKSEETENAENANLTETRRVGLVDNRPSRLNSQKKIHVTCDT